jgi:hypothetical protein
VKIFRRQLFACCGGSEVVFVSTIRGGAEYAMANILSPYRAGLQFYLDTGLAPSQS